MRDELLDRIQRGLAGKAEHIMLLDFLDAHPDLLDARSEAVLDDLARTLQAGDFGPLRALARLYARRGDFAEATRLYRWLATKVAALGAWYSDEEARIDARELFEEVLDVLGQDGVDPGLLADVAADIVFFASAGSDPWSRSQQDTFALEVWTKVLPPAEALERLSRLTDSISTTHFDTAPARQLAKSALELYLKAGQLDRALVCLEVALCTFDESLFDDVEYLWPSPSYPGNLSGQDLAKLFPSQAPDFPAPEDWYRAAAAALFEWHSAGRISGAVATRGIALATWRLDQLGATGGASLEALIETCLAQPSDATARRWSSSSQADGPDESQPDSIQSFAMLNLIDAARLTGRAGLGNRLEEHLERTGRLPIARVPALVNRLLVQTGPGRALAVGERYLATYHTGELIETLREAALALGATERAAELEALAAQEQAAREKLAELGL